MPIQTLAGEALFVLPWIWVPMMILFVHGFRRGAASFHQLLVWLAAPPIVGFALISAWSNQRVLYHWAAPGYLMLFPLLGEALARRLDRAWVRGLVAGSAGLVLASVTVIATQVRFDWLGGTLAAVMRTDPTAEGVDWTSVREDLAGARVTAARCVGGDAQLARCRQDWLRSRAGHDNVMPQPGLRVSSASPTR